MKANFVLFFVFLSMTISSQTNFIVDKKGNKSIIRDDVGEVILFDKRISYTLVGKTWEKYIKFDNLDYASIGPTILKSFKLNKKNKSEVYYIFAEKKDKKLIGVAINVTNTYSKISSSRTFYHLYVIDNDSNIIEGVDFDSTSTNKEIEERAKLAPLVRKYFSDCPQIIESLNQFDFPNEKNTSIIGFFNNPKYISCT